MASHDLHPLKFTVFSLFLHGKIRENLDGIELNSCGCEQDGPWELLCFQCQEKAKNYYRNLGYTEAGSNDEDFQKELEELEEGEVEEEEEEEEGVGLDHRKQEQARDPSEIFDLNEDPATRKLIYLTPAMIELFRQGEMYRLNAKREISLEKEEIDLENHRKKANSYLFGNGSSSPSDLKLIIDEAFENGTRTRQPILWPILSMRF